MHTEAEALVVLKGTRTTKTITIPVYETWLYTFEKRVIRIYQVQTPTPLTEKYETIYPFGIAGQHSYKELDRLDRKNDPFMIALKAILKENDWDCNYLCYATLDWEPIFCVDGRLETPISREDYKGTKTRMSTLFSFRSSTLLDLIYSDLVKR